MTQVSGPYWNERPGVYRQPPVIKPPTGQNANNARHAIWHFGSQLVMEVYPTGGRYRVGDSDLIDDGRHDRGAMRLVTVRGVIQPNKAGSIDLVQDYEGERSEGSLVLHLDSHEPFNIAAAQGDVDIFPNGIRLIGPDMLAPDDRFNHVAVFQFRGRRWKVLSVAELFKAGDEDLQTDGAIYRAELGLFADRSHERSADPSLQAPEWGPE